MFDLGGVILDLSVDTTLHSFASLSGMDGTQVKKLFVSSSGFLEYEKGLISDEAFRLFVRETYRVEASDEKIDACWNAMLLGIPQVKLELLLRLKERYQVFLLSNTNNIHLQYINKKILPTLSGDHSLDPYFHKTYYSHLMKMRKPDAEIFMHVLNENGLNPTETLFLDDNADNIAGAQAVDIETVYVTSPDMIIDYFHA